ncbi:MAG: type II toxin-antitoxin system RelE/ParE family toxin [Steroidobacteraceae bacterium]|nr:type II toxin-antitoxin system RelE/ParE family toxin [Steroidobacteraceae bacterium]
MTPKPVVPCLRAEQDVDEAIRYYLGENAPEAALGFIDALERAYDRIGRHPDAGPGSDLTDSTRAVRLRCVNDRPRRHLTLRRAKWCRCIAGSIRRFGQGSSGELHSRGRAHVAPDRGWFERARSPGNHSLRHPGRFEPQYTAVALRDCARPHPHPSRFFAPVQCRRSG